MLPAQVVSHKTFIHLQSAHDLVENCQDSTILQNLYPPSTAHESLNFMCELKSPIKLPFTCRSLGAVPDTSFETVAHLAAMRRDRATQILAEIRRPYSGRYGTLLKLEVHHNLGVNHANIWRGFFCRLPHLRTNQPLDSASDCSRLLLDSQDLPKDAGPKEFVWAVKGGQAPRCPYQCPKKPNKKCVQSCWVWLGSCFEWLFWN